jgi:hypothetical protein
MECILWKRNRKSRGVSQQLPCHIFRMSRKLGCVVPLSQLESWRRLCYSLYYAHLLEKFGLVNVFTDHLYTLLGTTRNYSATDNLYNSQSTTAPIKRFPAVPWKRLLTVEIFQLHALRSSLYRLRYRTHINWLTPNLSVITSRHGTCRKNSSSIVEYVYVADVTWSRLLSNGSVRHNIMHTYFRSMRTLMYILITKILKSKL